MKRKGNKDLRTVIEKAYNVRPNLGFISQTVKEKGIKELEIVKPNVVRAQAVEITTAQEKILEIETKSESFEEEIDERGFGYKLRWFFGRVAEQEKQDAEFLRSQGQRLSETADLLLQISEQVEEPAKTILIEQAESLQEQAQEILKKAENNEKNAKGFLSWFGL